MRIPKRFKIFGKTVEVIYDEQLRLKDDASGTASFRRNVVTLQPSSSHWPLAHESIEQTYFHEVTHIILRAICEPDLCDNEKFVDTFASALHQVLTTAEYK